MISSVRIIINYFIINQFLKVKKYVILRHIIIMNIYDFVQSSVEN